MTSGGRFSSYSDFLFHLKDFSWETAINMDQRMNVWISEDNTMNIDYQRSLLISEKKTEIINICIVDPQSQN